MFWVGNKHSYFSDCLQGLWTRSCIFALGLQPIGLALVSQFGTCLIFLLRGFQYIFRLYLNILDLVCDIFELESAMIVWHSSSFFNLWVFNISCTDVPYTTIQYNTTWEQPGFSFVNETP